MAGVEVAQGREERTEDCLLLGLEFRDACEQRVQLSPGSFQFISAIERPEQGFRPGPGLVPAGAFAQDEGVEQQPARGGCIAGFLHIGGRAGEIARQVAAQFLLVEYVVPALGRQHVHAHAPESGSGVAEAAELLIALRLGDQRLCRVVRVIGVEGRTFILHSLQLPVRPLLRLTGKRCAEEYGCDKG